MSEDSSDLEPTYCETKPGKWVKIVREMIRDLNYGEVQLTIHKGEVIEIRKMEKVRLDSRPQ